MLAKYRKLHPFISKFLSPGNEYVVFDLYGWTAGILICYDNNVVENVRVTALLGAQIIFMPHVGIFLGVLVLYTQCPRSNEILDFSMTPMSHE